MIHEGKTSLDFDCPRCGRHHSDVTFHEFNNYVKLGRHDFVRTHWAMCPKLEEPILARFGEVLD